MREAQKAFFKNKSNFNLRKAKALEKRVDDYLKAQNTQSEPKAQQKEFFKP